MQIVVIFSDANFLALGLLENLLTKNCIVNIVTKDYKNWQNRTTYITNKNRFSIIEQEKYDNKNFSYAIVFAGFIKGDPYEFINEIFNKYNLRNSKNLILLPFEKYSFIKNQEIIVPDNIGIVYFGDLIGPRIDLETDLLIGRTINSIYYKRKITVGIGELIYPVFISDAVKTLSKWIFSFGPYGKESILIGPQISATDFWKENQNFIKDVKLSYDEKIESRKLPHGLEIKNIPCDLAFSLKETYLWLSKNQTDKIPKLIPPKTKRNKTVIKYPKYLKPLIFVTLLAILFPIFMLIISSGLLYLSYGQFLAGNDKNSVNLMYLSKTFSVVSQNESAALSYIPLIGKAYRESSFISNIYAKTADIGVESIPVFRSSADLISKILGNTIYDPEKDSKIISEGLENIYKLISFMQVDTNTAVTSKVMSAEILDSKINLEKYKNLALYGKTIADDIPGILGKEETKTYLILFQNNMELRPTGGFIGSFGLLTFDGGRITDLTVNDVYSADGQLNGHVEPPAPIKQYLNEANWWLRDSNWDPDFPTSAKRAEWFLDKEMGKDVDGVFAIDLDPVKNILKYTGPVFLPDYNEEITSDNLYEKTQSEVQDNFFPGSRKKSSFLTALSRSLLSEVTKVNQSQKMGILKSFYSDLNARHIQLFIHNGDLQNAISKLSWDGAITVPNCGETCFADFAGEVEANLGVNKSNYFIQRRQDLTVKLSSSEIERTYDLTLKNNSNSALGPSGIYSAYIRFIVPKDAQVESVNLLSGVSSQQLNPDITEENGRKEVGMYVQVVSGQTKTIEIKWANSFKPGEAYTKYGIYIRRQAGVGDDPFSLTINGKKVYNNTLAEDYFGRFTLK